MDVGLCRWRERYTVQLPRFPEAVAPSGRIFPPPPQLHQGLSAEMRLLLGTSVCSMVQPSSPLEELLQRVRGEYREMPGLRLTSLQAQRLFGLDPLACAAVLGALVKESFLYGNRDGLFARLDGPVTTLATTPI